MPVEEEPVTQRETDPLLGNKEKDKKTYKKRKRPSLTKAIIKMFACNFLTAIVFKLIQDCLIFVQPQLLRLVLTLFQSYPFLLIAIGEDKELTKNEYKHLQM